MQKPRIVRINQKKQIKNQKSAERYKKNNYLRFWAPIPRPGARSSQPGRPGWLAGWLPGAPWGGREPKTLSN